MYLLYYVLFLQTLPVKNNTAYYVKIFQFE